jgi:hypothetical protein
MAENFDFVINEEDGVAVKQRILEVVGQRLDALCAERGCSLKDLASTLLFVAVKAGKFVICHIGDGVIGYFKNGEVLVASHPENGEFANTTVFTTSNNAIASMKLIKGNLKQISGFVLMSDGTENSFYNKRNKVLSPSLVRLFKLVSVCDADIMSRGLYNNLENCVKPKTSDDCSMVLMLRSADGFESFSDAGKCELLRLANTRASRKRLKSIENIL